MEIQINANFVETNSSFVVGNTTVLITPPINEEYWLFRVPLSDKQAIVGFPKFGTIGIGFQVEDDWNTNLPYQCTAEEIYNHIQHNRQDDCISKEMCLTAISMIQRQARLWKESGK